MQWLEHLLGGSRLRPCSWRPEKSFGGAACVSPQGPEGTVLELCAGQGGGTGAAAVQGVPTAAVCRRPRGGFESALVPAGCHPCNSRTTALHRRLCWAGRGLSPSELMRPGRGGGGTQPSDCCLVAKRGQPLVPSTGGISLMSPCCLPCPRLPSSPSLACLSDTSFPKTTYIFLAVAAASVLLLQLPSLPHLPFSITTNIYRHPCWLFPAGWPACQWVMVPSWL